MSFRDTRFSLTLLSEDTKSYYTTRVLELQNINVRQSYLGNGEFPVKGGKRELKWSHQDTSRGSSLLDLRTVLFT